MQTTNPTLSFYQNIAGSPSLLANGYSLIRDFLLENQSNREQTLLLLQNVMVISLVVNVYPKQIFGGNGVSAHQKKDSRKYIMALTVRLLQQKDKGNMVDHLLKLISNIHNEEGFEEWSEVYEQAIKQLIESRSTMVGHLVVSVMKNADDRVQVLSKHFLKLFLLNQLVSRECTLEVLYYCYKSMAYLTQSDPSTMAQHVQPYLAATLSLITTHISSSKQCMKYCLKLMTVLAADYSIQLDKAQLAVFQQTSKQLVLWYIQHLGSLSYSNTSQLEEQQFQEQVEEVSPQQLLYQMMELMMALIEVDVYMDTTLVIYICIIGLYLSPSQYAHKAKCMDLYLVEIEDEGDKNIRNKSIFFLGEILEHNHYQAHCQKMLQDYADCFVGGKPLEIVASYLAKYQLPSTVIANPKVYQESALYLVYSLPSINPPQAALLASILSQNPIDSLQNILLTLILNKLMRNVSQQQKNAYGNYLKQYASKACNNVGLLVAIIRGLYAFCSVEGLVIKDEEEGSLHSAVIAQLVGYLMRNDSSQGQIAYLIIEFMLKLASIPLNQSTLKGLLTHKFEVQLLKQYFHDSLSAPIIVDLLSIMASPQTIQQVLSFYGQGSARDERMGELVGKWIRTKRVVMNDNDMSTLAKLYEGHSDSISEILLAYIENNSVESQQLVDCLNRNLNDKWVLQLLKQNKLMHSELQFCNIVRKITNDLTSQCEIESLLALPYFFILHSPSQSLQILQSHQLFHPFFNKLLNYSSLFKGTHLRIVAFFNPQMAVKVIQLIDSYGQIKSDEWEDDEEEGEGDIEERMGRIMMNLDNQYVENLFKNVFGEKAWDSNALMERVGQLKQQYPI